MQILNARLGKVLAVYGSASFVVIQVIDIFQERMQLPEWLFGAAVILLLIGLPIVVTTSIVQNNEFKSALIEKLFTWRRAIGGGVVAFVVLLTGTAFYARDRFGGNTDLDANLVAVFPFRVSGAEASLHYLGEGMVDLLATKLSGEDGPRAADARSSLAAWRRLGDKADDTEQIVRAARSIGARRIILGEIVGNSGQLTISGSVTDTRTGRRVQHHVTGAADSISSLVDELAAVLLSLDAGEPLDRMASLTSTSLPAVRAYLLGEAAYRHSNHADAARYYLQALEADSTFAVAALGAMVAAGWGVRFEPGAVPRARRLAWTFRDKLSDLDRLKLMGYVGANYPEPEGEIAKCRFWRQIIERAPERAEAWHNVGDCHYHFGGLLNQANALNDARVAFERSMKLDSSFLPNVEHLLPLAALRRDSVAARQLEQIFFAQDTLSEAVDEMRWYAKYARSRPNSELLAVDTAQRGMAGVAQWALQYAEDVGMADSLWSLAVRNGALMRPDRRPAPATLAETAMWRGRHAEALRAFAAMDSATRGFGSSSALLYATYSDLDRGEAARIAVALEREIAAAAEQPVRVGQECALEQWRLWNGDASRTDAVLHRLRNLTGGQSAEDIALRRATGHICGIMLEAIRAGVQQRPDAKALALRVDSISAAYNRYGAHHLSIRLVASRLLEMAGDVKAARVAVGRVPSGYPTLLDEAGLLQAARLSAKLGDREDAIRNYQRYLALRSHPDAGGAIQTEQARGELAQLMKDK